MADTATREDPLSQFLREQITDEALLARVLEALDPYYQIAKSGGPYPLKPEKELDKAEIASAIQQALALEGEIRVATDSASNPHGWLKEVAEVVPWVILWTSLDASLDASLDDSLEVSLDASLDDSLWIILWNSLGASLETDLKISLETDLKTILRFNLWPNLQASLVYYLGFAVVGNLEMVERLESLVQIQTGCIVVAPKRDEEGTWLVLAA